MSRLASKIIAAIAWTLMPVAIGAVWIVGGTALVVMVALLTIRRAGEWAVGK